MFVFLAGCVGPFHTGGGDLMEFYIKVFQKPWQRSLLKGGVFLLAMLTLAIRKSPKKVLRIQGVNQSGDVFMHEIGKKILLN